MRRVRTEIRKRRKLVFLLMFVIIATATLSKIVSKPVNNNIETHKKATFVTVEVKPGNTLWSIAEAVTNEGRNWVQFLRYNPFLKKRIKTQKHKVIVEIFPGEKLRIPIKIP